MKNVKIWLIILLVIVAGIFEFFYFQNVGLNIMEKIKHSENNISQNNSENDSVYDLELNKDIPEEVSDKTFTMAVTGDIMCHNTMFQDAYDSETKEYDFSYYFDDVKHYLESADITVGNLETTFAGSAKGYSGYPTFNTPEKLAQNLKDVGFDFVSTANNHCMDKGFIGLVSTIEHLDEVGISHTGTFVSEEEQNKSVIKEVNDLKIAFLSFTYGTNGIAIPEDKKYAVNLIDKELIAKQIEIAKTENPDLICVCMHWGIEYQTQPNDTQEDLTNFLIENGVDIILGNHPHVIQPIAIKNVVLEDETTKDAFVIYSLGNFMADQNKQYTRDSAILTLTITKNMKEDKIYFDRVEYTPTYMYNTRSGTTKKFKILDIGKTIADYEAGTETSISKSTYQTLLKEYSNVETLLNVNENQE